MAFGNQSTPEEQRAAYRAYRRARMLEKGVKAKVTGAPCTSRCWNAEEFVCSCSCGGKNHGRSTIS